MSRQILRVVAFVIFGGVIIILGMKGHPPARQPIHREWHFNAPSTEGAPTVTASQGNSQGNSLGVSSGGAIVPVVPPAPIHPLVYQQGSVTQ
ncbi:MAG: hypothetical protein J6P29_01910 [Acetobacter sp.]|nr:hypothetical protein [Acetobacter sp.]